MRELSVVGCQWERMSGALLVDMIERLRRHFWNVRTDTNH
jgi:hypothetical protein